MQKRQKDKSTNKARKIGISGSMRFLPLFVCFAFLLSPFKEAD
jgi:hypothetical protein